MKQTGQIDLVWWGRGRWGSTRSKPNYQPKSVKSYLSFCDPKSLSICLNVFQTVALDKCILFRAMAGFCH